MKKKFVLITVLLAALVLIFTGCPGGGDEPPPETNPGEYEGTWYLTTTEGGTPITNNQTVIPASNENSNVYIYFDPTGKEFEKIKLTYDVGTTDKNVNCTALYDTFETDVENDKVHTWGTTNWNYNMAGGTVEIDPAVFTDKWTYNATTNPTSGQKDRTAIDKTKIKGLCFSISTGNEATTFKLLNVEFIGLEGGGGLPSNPSGVTPPTDTWYLGTAEGGTLKAVDNKWYCRVTDTKDGVKDTYIYIYFPTSLVGSNNSITVNFTLTPAQNISWQCAYDTGTWGANEGYIDSKDAGPITTELTKFSQDWYHATTTPSLDKASLKGICLKVSFAELTDEATFTLTGVSFQ